MKLIPVIALLLVLLHVVNGCKKPGDLYGNNLLRGRLFFKDDISGAGAKPLPGKTIYLSYASTRDTRFLYTAVTDTGGYFLFSSLNKDSLYNLLYTDSIGGAVVTADSSLRVLKDELDLAFFAKPNLQRQNVLSITCVDASGDPVPGARVCVFNNLAFANANPCVGSILTLTANAQGKIIHYSLPAGTLHFNAQSPTDVLPALSGSSRNVSVPAVGVIPLASITLN